MKRPRRTRVQQSQETEQRLLDAAFEVFTRQGFHGSAIDEVAAAAGLTTGAVYSRFEGKAELLLALLERTIEGRIAHLDALRARGEPDVGSASERAWWRSVLERPEWMLLVIEFRVHAARHPALNARYAALHERHVQAHAETMREDARRAGSVLTEPARDVARIAMALAAGMVLERWSLGDAFDPDLPLRASAALGHGILHPASPPRTRRASRAKRR